MDCRGAVMGDGPKPPRYEARESEDGYIVYDTFTQGAVVNERHSSKARAAVAAGRMNAAYERAMQ